jgi:hypothetical protein
MILIQKPKNYQVFDFHHLKLKKIEVWERHKNQLRCSLPMYINLANHRNKPTSAQQNTGLHLRFIRPKLRFVRKPFPRRCLRPTFDPTKNKHIFITQQNGAAVRNNLQP